MHVSESSVRPVITQSDGKLTEKLSTRRNRRSIHAQNATEVMKAIVPSTVLLVPGQRLRPQSLPMMEACRRNASGFLFVANLRGRKCETHQTVADAEHEDAGEAVDLPTFEPETASAARQQVKVAKNDGSAVLRVDKLGEKDVQGRADRVERKVARVFREGEEREGDGEGERGESRL